MYCSTCGAFVAENRSHCTECGTRVVRHDIRPEPRSERPASRPEQPETRPAPRFGSQDRRWMVERAVGLCPRCSYQGEGVSYFSRGRHVAALVGATVVTSGAMGAGGIIYYLMRRDYRVCPRCGKGWGRYGEKSLAPMGQGRIAQASAPRVPSARRESSRRFFAGMLWVFAVIMIIGAIVSAELAPALFAAAAGAGGWMLQRSANQAREERRAALLSELQLQVLQLAREYQGRLTVTEVAGAMGWPLRRAEKVLHSLDDGLRVNSEVTDEGVIVYEFLEVMHGPRRLSGGSTEHSEDEV
jgi:ribosomal protein S27AE